MKILNRHINIDDKWIAKKKSHEKMLSIINHQKNVNSNHNELSLHIRMALRK